MCEESSHKYPYALEYVPDKFKTLEMCEKAVTEDPYALKYVPDWFITLEICVIDLKRKIESKNIETEKG